MVREYTPIVEDIQIRDINYLSCLDKYPENPTRFDIVKWVNCEPFETIDGRSGIEKTIDKYCYSIGTLEWNKHEPCFEFKSIGLRWLEAKPSNKVINMILGFCKMMESVLDNDYE